MQLPVSPGAYDAGSMGRKKVANELGTPLVAAAQCTLCLYCWIYCPEGAVGVGPETVAIDLALCKGCGICATECPHGAITMQAIAGASA